RTLISAQQGKFLELESTLLSWAEDDNPDMAAVQELLVQHYAYNSQLKKGLKWGQRFLKHYPDHIAVLKTMAFIHSRLINPTDCLRCYRRVLKLRPDLDQVREEMAFALVEFKEPQEALRNYQELQVRHPESVTVLLGLARAHRLQGDLAKARQILEELAVKHPKEGDVFTELGKL